MFGGIDRGGPEKEYNTWERGKIRGGPKHTDF